MQYQEQDYGSQNIRIIIDSLATDFRFKSQLAYDREIKQSEPAIIALSARLISLFAAPLHNISAISKNLRDLFF